MRRAKTQIVLDLITIDGPGGVGKTTVAHLLAEELGVVCLDTGAMYRAIAFAALERGIDPDDAVALAEMTDTLDLRVDERVLLDGQEVTAHIRTVEVTNIVSSVARHPEVRDRLRRVQRTWVESQNQVSVVEGRDMGSIVFPDAKLKIFLNANLRRRAERRHPAFPDLPIEEVQRQLAERDHQDILGGFFNLPDGGLIVDTTSKTQSEVVRQILDLYHEA